MNRRSLLRGVLGTAALGFFGFRAVETERTPGAWVPPAYRDGFILRRGTVIRARWFYDRHAGSFLVEGPPLPPPYDEGGWVLHPPST